MITTSPDLIEKKEVTTDESGISINGEINKEFIKWEGFVDFIETKSHFILFNTILSAIILPKDFIEKKGLLDDMRHLLKSKSDQLNIKYTTFN
ncbi:YcxB family protein [Candidatus Gracilibacteria bacterium]|nr:YcxB family protein [Candidatus Gracilibacteria bacterium]